MYNPYEEINNRLKRIESTVEMVLERIPETPSIRKYSPRELAENAPISEQTVIKAIRDGRMKAVKFGRKYLISAAEFERVCRDVKSIKYQRSA